MLTLLLAPLLDSASAAESGAALPVFQRSLASYFCYVVHIAGKVSGFVNEAMQSYMGEKESDGQRCDVQLQNALRK